MNDVDPLVRWGVPCKLLGDLCRRTLYEMVKRGDFPPPDRKARKRGEPDLWRMSTVRAGVERYASSESRGGSVPESKQLAAS